MRTWLAGKRVKASTASTYKTAVEWWAARLGEYFVDAVTPADVTDTLEGAHEGGDASETCNGRLRVIRTFAKETGVHGIVGGVKVIEADVRETERMETEGRGLSLPELRALLTKGPTAWLKKDGTVMPAWRRAWALIATMAYTGLRFSEASALEWHDIDLDAATLRVRRSQWRGEVGHVKAAASKREVVMPDELVEVLREHRRAMVARQQVGVATALVFPTRRVSAKSAHVTNGHAGKAMLRALKVAKVEPDGRPWVHCLRHTFNNLVRQVTSELVRRALVGHADDESGERYSRVTLEEKRRASSAVLTLIRGA